MKQKETNINKPLLGKGAENFFDSPDEQELERRWPVALRELTSLFQRIKDIRGANPEKLPDQISHIEKKQLMKVLYQSIFEKDDLPELKRSVARKMANKIGDYLLWRRDSSIPVIHELIVLLPWWITNFGKEAMYEVRDIGLKYVLNGRVVPVQSVWQDILDAPLVYLGHCVCRSSGIVNDLHRDGKVFSLLSEDQNSLLLNRFMGKYDGLMQTHGKLPDTDSHYSAMFKTLDNHRKNGSSEFSLDTLLESTYSSWEILPVLDKYTQSWVHSMHKNHKAHLIHKELVFELATILYLSRGTIFTAMQLFDNPYTICSCPTPETGGGCVLTNWYYKGMSNSSLVPNENGFGRRKDKDGNLMPCGIFPLRNTRECLGCGCEHESSNPRGMNNILEQSDKAYENYKTTI